jgi:hypothetical protein
MPDRLLLTIEQLTFYAIETAPGQFPAHEFIENLDDVGKLHLRVAARILATTLATGRPPAGRSERVRGSTTGLYELRLTPPGRRGAHARLLYIREGNAIRCVRGVLKRERLRRRDIQLADHDINADRNQR